MRRGIRHRLHLCLILFLSAFLLGLGLHLRSGRRILPGEEWTVMEGDTQGIVEGIIQGLLEDQSPESDSAQDGIWQTLPFLEKEYGAKIILQDVSSRVNPNHWRDEIIDGTSLGALLFREGHSMGELEQYRGNNSMGQNLEAAYPGFFSDEALRDSITPYGYLNLNIASESAIEELYTLRTGDAFGVESFSAQIREKRSNQTYLNNASLREFLPRGKSELYPFLAAVPLLNIHFVPGEILKGILSHDFRPFSLPGGADAAGRILEERATREFRSGELRALFGLENFNHPVYDYLGVKTWFWRITIKKNGRLREVILAKLPDSEFPYRPDGKFTVPKEGKRERCLQIIQNRFQSGGTLDAP